jgi:hypothetical protein
MAATFKSQCWLAQQNLKEKREDPNKQSSDMPRKASENLQPTTNKQKKKKKTTKHSLMKQR